MRHFAISSVGILLLLVLFVAEKGGLFLLLSYGFLKFLCLCLSLLFFAVGTFVGVKKQTIRSSMSAAIVALLLLTFSFTIEFISTSKYKRFYVVAHRIKPGDRLESALWILRDYETRSECDKENNSCYLYSQCAAERGTTDRVHFKWDPRTRKIVNGPDWDPD